MTVTTFLIAARALRRTEARSILTILGIVVGVAALITVSAIGSGAHAKLTQQIAALGANLIVAMPGSRMLNGVRLGSGSRESITEDDAVALQQELTDVQVAAPLLRGRGHLAYGRTNWSTVFYGVTPGYLDARDWRVAVGAAFDREEMVNADKVVLLGETVRQNLFEYANPLGSVIRVGKVPMLVVGVLEPKGQSFTGLDLDDVLLMPITTARHRVLGVSSAKVRSVGSIFIKVRDGADVERVRDAARVLLRQRHQLQAGEADDFSLHNMVEITSAREQSSRAISLGLIALAAVSLLVGGVGIANIMLLSVTERTREIGLRMAVGARRLDIMWQFLLEAVMLSGAGALGGLLLGILTTQAFGYFSGWPVPFEVSAASGAMLAAGAVGLIAGLFPAHRASRLQPIDALRKE